MICCFINSRPARTEIRWPSVHRPWREKRRSSDANSLVSLFLLLRDELAEPSLSSVGQPIRDKEVKVEEDNERSNKIFPLKRRPFMSHTQQKDCGPRVTAPWRVEQLLTVETRTQQPQPFPPAITRVLSLKSNRHYLWSFLSYFCLAVTL